MYLYETGLASNNDINVCLVFYWFGRVWEIYVILIILYGSKILFGPLMMD